MPQAGFLDLILPPAARAACAAAQHHGGAHPTGGVSAGRGRREQESGEQSRQEAGNHQPHCLGPQGARCGNSRIANTSPRLSRCTSST
eukprot:1195597-Prorocentrum_minimum.AAC.6